jgi:hypothetical protein
MILNSHRRSRTDDLPTQCRGLLSRFAICLLQFAIASASATYCLAAARIEAYRGATFGIGRVTLEVPQNQSAAPATDNRVALTEANGRVLYPVMKNRSSGRLLHDLLGVDLPGRVTFLFMFRGDEPLDLTAYTPASQSISITPKDDPKKFESLVGEWWNATADHYSQVFRQAAYPIVVENYLTATWARRLNREMPEPKRYLFQRSGIGAPWMSQLMANEAYQTQVERDLLTETARSNDSDLLPLPAAASEIAPPPSPLPPPHSTLAFATEPLAAHVPQECFYMRFGNFTNYLWYRDFMRHWQGDIGNMVVVESVDHNISERFQQQIAVGESKLARVMGPTVVNDVAFIGFDAYLRDGAAMGILFQANNTAMLKNNLSNQRQAAKAKHADAIEETVKIAGHDVSYIHTPDGRLLSYYALDGDFHLVTTCRALVERFYQAGAGDRSLAATADFQDCRATMPLTRDDTIFLFAPPDFFQNLASPQYRVELDRRLRSVGEMRAILLAQLAAAAEVQPDNSIDDLIAAELLPPGFGQRSDGSKLEFVRGREGEAPAEPPQPGQLSSSPASAYRDTLRGDAGWMTPIPDMQTDRITRAEAQRLSNFQQQLQTSVAGFAPVCAAMKRSDSKDEKGWDRIIANVRVTRYSQMPIAKWPKMLGEAQSNRVAKIDGDAVSLEIVLGALGDPMHLFGGIRDFNSPLIVRQGEVQTAGPITDAIRAYVGGWPRPQLLDRFLGRPAGPLDADGIARTGGLFDLWFRRADDFFLFSFKRDVLLEVGRQLAILPAERPAQIRLHIDDLTNKKIATTVNGFGYMRARDTSASASRFMNSLTTQLHVAPEQARILGEELAGGKFACPLGGKYVLVDPQHPNDGEVASATGNAPTTRKLWISTAPPTENRFLLTVIPADYQMPFMNWFRGLTADVARANDELTLNVQLDMVHIDVAPPEDPDAGGILQLPSLGNLFSGFGAKKDEAVKPASATEEQTSRTHN